MASAAVKKNDLAGGSESGARGGLSGASHSTSTSTKTTPMPATDGAATPAKDGAPSVPPVTGAVVDMDVFGQLLEIDDDDGHEFSKTLAFDYISQAETTFQEIAEALSAKDLDTLSRKGHFLKGSSAALGLQRVQHLCEAMQHTGAKKDASGDGPTLTDQDALKRCSALLDALRTEQQAAKEWLESFYAKK